MPAAGCTGALSVCIGPIGAIGPTDMVSLSLSLFPHLCAVSQLHTRAGVTADVSISDDYGVHAAKFLAEQVWWPLTRDVGRAGAGVRKGQGPGGALQGV